MIPQMVKLVDLVPHITKGTNVCIRCRYGSMQDYADFHGNDAMNIPVQVLSSLCIENITTRLVMFPDGLIPTLVIEASDNVTMVTFDPNGFFQQVDDSDPDQEEDPTS